MPIRPENRGRYPADWPQISKRIREERAGGRCECRGVCLNPPGATRVVERPEGHHHLEADGRCGARNGELLPSGRWRVVLTVAHLDHTPENVGDENLLAMCQACHLRYDAPHHAETRRLVRRATGDDPGAQLLF